MASHVQPTRTFDAGGIAAARAHGFTLFEALIVIAILGVIAALAVPSISTSLSRQDTQETVTEVSGLLKEARDRAEQTGIPHIIYFLDEGACTSGLRGTYARVVRDNDFSYSESPGDLTRNFSLPAEKCDVTPYGKAGEPAPFPDMTLPDEDDSLLAAALVSRYPLTREVYAEVRARLREREAGRGGGARSG